jgi:hypothetical protein
MTLMAMLIRGCCPGLGHGEHASALDGGFFHRPVLFLEPSLDAGSISGYRFSSGWISQKKIGSTT